MDKKTKTCEPKVTEKRFLWWTWNHEEETHDWRYLDFERRVCAKCGLSQIKEVNHFEDGTPYDVWLGSAKKFKYEK